jgi:hypothetical protein
MKALEVGNRSAGLIISCRHKREGHGDITMPLIENFFKQQIFSQGFFFLKNSDEIGIARMLSI